MCDAKRASSTDTASAAPSGGTRNATPQEHELNSKPRSYFKIGRSSKATRQRKKTSRWAQREIVSDADKLVALAKISTLELAEIATTNIALLITTAPLPPPAIGATIAVDVPETSTKSTAEGVEAGNLTGVVDVFWGANERIPLLAER